MQELNVKLSRVAYVASLDKVVFEMLSEEGELVSFMSRNRFFNEFGISAEDCRNLQGNIADVVLLEEGDEMLDGNLYVPADDPNLRIIAEIEVHEAEEDKLLRFQAQIAEQERRKQKELDAQRFRALQRKAKEKKAQVAKSESGDEKSAEKAEEAVKTEEEAD